MDLSNANDNEVRDMIRESKLLSTLRHPYIVRYRDSFSNGKTLCIVMEYCEGGDLAARVQEQRIRRDTFKECHVLRWLTQALLALKYVHEQKVLHRDIKTSNLFLVKGKGSSPSKAVWNLKVGDFGISKSLDSTVSYAQTQIGTPYYLAPEVCQDKPYSWGNDIWAMGCVLYELCALHVPFQAESLVSLMQRITHGQVPVLPDSYSERLRRVGSDMLTRDSVMRPSAAFLLQMPLLQKCMVDLLEEEQPSCVTKVLEKNDVRRRSFDAGDVRYRHSAGTYQLGDQVEYCAEFGADWLPATVVGDNKDGCIRIDLLPGMWLRTEDQATRVRPGKTKPGSAHLPTPKARAAAMMPLLNDRVAIMMGLD